MSAALLLRELQAAGVSIEVRGDQIAIRPASRLTPNLVQRLRAAKPALLNILTTRVRIEETEDDGRPAYRLVRAVDNQPLLLGLFASRRWAEVGAREHGLEVVL